MIYLLIDLNTYNNYSQEIYVYILHQSESTAAPSQSPRETHSLQAEVTSLGHTGIQDQSRHTRRVPVTESG